MTLYEIDKAIIDCIDAETGEIIDPEKLTALQMEREKKIEGVALWIKNLKAELNAIEAERKVFQERETKYKARIESLSNWLTSVLNGQKFQTSKVVISFRNSEAVEITDLSKIPDEYIKQKFEVSADKTAIKEALKSNFQISGAKLIKRQNIQIK